MDPSRSPAANDADWQNPVHAIHPFDIQDPEHVVSDEEIDSDPMDSVSRALDRERHMNGHDIEDDDSDVEHDDPWAASQTNPIVDEPEDNAFLYETQPTGEMRQRKSVWDSLKCCGSCNTNSIASCRMCRSCNGGKLTEEELQKLRKSLRGLKRSPEETCTIFSKLSYSWASPLIKYGYSCPLEQDDLWPLCEKDETEKLSNEFNGHFQDVRAELKDHLGTFYREEERIKRAQKEAESSDGKTSADDDSLAYEKGQGAAPSKVGSFFERVKAFFLFLFLWRVCRRQPSSGANPIPRKYIFVRVFNRFKLLSRNFYMAGLIKLFHDTLQFCSPLFVKWIIGFVADDNASAMDGYMLAVGLISIQLLTSVCIAQYFQRTFRVGMQVRSVLMSAVYQKALRLSSKGRHQFGVGNIVNLMSNDAKRLQDVFTYLHSLWSGPLQIIVSLILLWWTIGPPALAGLLVMVLMLPVSGFLARRLTKIRRSVMKYTDERVHWINEILQGFKSIKLHAWEGPFKQKLQAVRTHELKHIRRSVYLRAVNMFISVISPTMVSVATFVLYAATRDDFSAEKAFVALSYFNIMRFPLAMLPRLVNGLADCRVSLARIEDFLQADEVQTVTHADRCAPGEHVVRVTKGSFSWNKSANSGDGMTAPERQRELEDVEVVLRDINLEVPRGKLTVVVGRVGSGKSTLLSSLIGETAKVAGEVTVCGSVAYVAQEAWIQNLTLRENILFGDSMHKPRYKGAIVSCALVDDLRTLPAGDATEIGERGINLSGGQKQRVNLARAVYADADVYVMDDCLSAVDAHVGRHIFEECICGALGSKTRVLATHQVQFLPFADEIICLEDGRVKCRGTYDDLVEMGIDFASMAGEDSDDSSEEKESGAEEQQTDGAAGEAPEKKESLSADSPELEELLFAKPATKEKGDLITVEERETGSVGFIIYKRYIHAMGGASVIIGMILLLVLAQFSRSGSDWWLSYWSDKSQDAQEGGTREHGEMFYAEIYGMWGVATGVLTLIRGLWVGYFGVRAAAWMHSHLVDSVLHAPMAFMDQTPIGRILNRFSNDMDKIDSDLPEQMNSFLQTVAVTIGSVGLVMFVTPWFTAPLLAIGVIYYRVQDYYRSSSREVKRLESISRSPIFAHFSETLSGLQTIRAYGHQERFSKESAKRIDTNNRSYWVLMQTNRWLGFRLEGLGNIIVGLNALLIAVLHGSIDPGIAGMTLTNSLAVVGWLTWLVRMWTEFEMAMNSVERVTHYVNIPPEAAWDVDDVKVHNKLSKRAEAYQSHSEPRKSTDSAYRQSSDIVQSVVVPDDTWPSSGEIRFDHLTMRYRENLPAVLKDISITVRPGEKIGVVGRTGAGKSTLIASLFRLVEPVNGHIDIDGLNIHSVGLRYLRQAISIVPQDPVLFSGTVRMNLDPFNDYDDHAIWSALSQVELRETIGKLSGQLLAEVAEGGQNFSVGQRQLLCLGRALLHNNRILVMDEATSNVDAHTDSVIQATIRRAFKDCTVVTIAHRLNTIIDADRVLCMKNGEVVEFDEPFVLLKKRNGLFASIVKETGENVSAMLWRMAEQAHARRSTVPHM